LLEKHFYSPPFSTAFSDWLSKLEKLDPAITVVHAEGMTLVLDWTNDSGLAGKIILNFAQTTYIDQESTLSCAGFRAVIITNRGGSWQIL